MSEGVGREPWVHLFTAQPSELAELRRTLRIRLILWGLHAHVDVAQLCVSELVTNVIRHVGEGTPVTLRMALREPYLRLEVEDPDMRALPTLLAAGAGMESGRGVALVDILSDHRWGVFLQGDSKVVWCELATADVPAACALPSGSSALRAVAAEEAAIGVMVDLLHWLHACGYDPDDVLDRAQTHFEAALGEVV
ncbi:ATP-binding protein [Streptomyces canus]|uniref:ATP-binding protein n=1 Tax=Streptomyces canus TaxID=58343 RepID=UPI0027D7FBA7|nr:ATP-binding protein [Streptomyces canus]